MLFTCFVLLSAATADRAADTSALVKQFEATYRSSKTLRADFLETYFDNGKEVRAEAGIAYFSKPGKMRWEYISPEANLYVLDGKWAWFYVPADHTVTRIKAKASADARTPLALLAGEMKLSRICKSVVEDSSAAVNPRGVVLRCVLRGEEDTSSGAHSQDGPKPEGHPAYALFELDATNGQLLRVRTADPGGVQVEFRFANWDFSTKLEDAKFHFVAPKGVAIVDGDLGGIPGN